jgi:hypothetical protein
MEERLTQIDVLSVAQTFPYEPLFNKVFITLNKIDEDGDLILSDNVLDEVQYVVAGEIKWGNTHIVPGDRILIDIEKLMVPVKQESNDAYQTVMQVRIDPVEVEGVQYAIIEDRVIKAKLK